MIRGNMTRRLVMGIMAVAVCLGTGIAMAGSTAAAPVASAAPGSVHRTRPASNTDGCEGKFSALTRGGDVYSYKSVNDNRGQMTGAAENFTQKGEADKNYWFSFSKQFGSGSYEALGVNGGSNGSAGAAYAVKPKIGVDQIARLKRGQRPTFTNEDLAEYTIVKRSADGSFTQSGPLDLRRANARVFSGNIPDKKNYHISAYRIRGGAVNPKDGKYYFAALVVKAQYIPAGRSPQVLNNMGAYLYRLDESNGWNVDFVGWYTIGRRETLQDSGSRTGDIAFNDNGDLYFLYQKADIGTEENKLDFLPAAELNRAAALSVAADAPINA